MSVVEVRHDRHRAGFAAVTDDALLDLPEAQPILARVGAAVDPDYPGRAEHVRRVASVAIRAKRTPFNAYARPTL